MDTTQTILFDVRDTPFPMIDFFPFWIVAGLGALIIFHLSEKGGKTRFGMRVWLFGWFGLGGIGMGSVFIEWMRCKNWADKGRYESVTGKVNVIEELRFSNKRGEKIEVDGIQFRYSDYDLTKGGFNQTISKGGPLTDGINVTIHYKNDRILIIEKGNGSKRIQRTHDKSASSGGK